jgi:divalent metal cation (Fe/Co/Zn/Cd) transporter
MIGRHAGLPALLAWTVVVVVGILVCIDPGSRDYLLGHGKMLNLVSLGLLLLVFTLTVVGWSITYTY